MLLSYKKDNKNGVGRGLNRVRRKNLIAQTIPDKIFGTKWSNPVKLDNKKKSLVSVLVFFLTAI